MAADDGDGIAKALLRSVVKTLDLCAPCKNRLLEKDGNADLPSDSETDIDLFDTASDAAPPTDDSSDHEFEIEYTQSTTKKARFSRSTLQNVVVDFCTWVNVSFTNCKLTDVTFKNATLRNAHFHNIDFTKVTFKNIELEDVEWTDLFLEHAVLNQDSYEIHLSQKNQIELRFPVMSWKATTRTRGGYNAGSGNAGVGSNCRHTPAGLKKVTLVLAPKTTFSSLPDSVCGRIASHLFPDFHVCMDNWRYRGMGDRRPKSRMFYTPPFMMAPTSYKADVSLRRMNQNPIPRLHPAILRVNRRLYDIAVFFLYDRRFNFRTQKVGLAFLHDHQRKEHQIRKIGLNIWDLEVLRKTLDVLVYDRPDLEEVFVNLPRRFWEYNPWRLAIPALLPPKYRKSLPLADWLRARDMLMEFTLLAKLPLKQNGRDVFINIGIKDHEKALERTVFLAALKMFMQRERSKQPDLHPQLHHGCCQEKTELEQSCYWNRGNRTLFKHYDLLQLPNNVLERILKYLFPVKGMKVMESPQILAEPWRYLQTTYKLTGTNSRSSYLGWKADSGDTGSTTKYVSGLGVAVNFLAVNRRCYELGSPHLYSNGIQFDSNPATCLAFFHDHRRDVHKIRSITLDYNEKSSCDVWRRLFNVLVHSRNDLRSLTVKIASNFWSAAPWRTMTAAATMNWKGWCKIENGRPCCGDRTFLHHIARIAAKDKDWKKINVAVEIEDSEISAEYRVFVRRLNDHITYLRSGRGNITIGVHGSCYRNGTKDEQENGSGPEPIEMELEKTCYWEHGMKCAE